jgi:pyruvate/2-oxoglutarate dehydrogenase complex dihydrolipoamide dehydrogenase (E3) component
VSTTLTAKTFLIATGSRIHTPVVPGLSEAGFLDSDQFLESERIPSSVIVLGGGAIALEAASFYAGVGSRVTLLQRSERILKEADPDASEALATGLRSRGIRVETGTQLCSASAQPDGKIIRFLQRGLEQEVSAEEIVCALGRQAATQGLGLESCGITLTGSRVTVSATQQTCLPHIFAAGDVCGPLEVVHIAIQQAETAARNVVRLLSGTEAPLEETDYRLKLLAIFSEPGIAMAGLTEADARSAGIPFLSASYPFNDHGKSMVEETLDGFVKLLVQAETREIIGASVVGPHAAELIHEVVVAMHFRATAGDLMRIPHYHPTLSEIWTYPAEELA